MPFSAINYVYKVTNFEPPSLHRSFQHFKGTLCNPYRNASETHNAHPLLAHQDDYVKQNKIKQNKSWKLTGITQAIEKWNQVSKNMQ